MEENPYEAIKTNVQGTKNIAVQHQGGGLEGVLFSLVLQDP
jgi:FlaA1/EpsC-like NDP-sugar epimerase